MERTNFIEGFTRDIAGDLSISKNDGRVKIGKKQFESVATSIKRPKKLSSKRVNAVDNAIEIQRKLGKAFERSRVQIEADERAKVREPQKFLNSKVRKMDREEKKYERNKRLGR